MNRYYLAIDIGASSGRHMIASVDNGKLILEEVYRFKNGISEKNGHLCWDIERLFAEVKNGLKRCKEIGKIPVSMGIDTWGVDFVLLDKDNNLIGDAVSYRDSRTDAMVDELNKFISSDKLYAKTGLQAYSYNTIYQLMALKKNSPEDIKKADSFLMIAPYLNFLLTGVKKNEYTNVTTTGLFNCNSRDWDEELLEYLNISKQVMGNIEKTGTFVGNFSKEVEDEIGFNCNVLLPATHDTASAVLSVPFEDDVIYISSGTWSLMGIELKSADCTESSRKLGLTNEGSAIGEFCCLQNIMGLWIIQSIKRNLDDKYSFGELSDMAREYADFKSMIDVNDSRFMAPDNMIDAIKEYCKDTNQPVPSEIGEIMQCVYQSLAKCYKDATDAIEDRQGKKYGKIAIVGGGCQDTYLNELTAKATGKEVSAGPIEATAIGNILVQLMEDKAVENLAEAKALIN